MSASLLVSEDESSSDESAPATRQVQAEQTQSEPISDLPISITNNENEQDQLEGIYRSNGNGIDSENDKEQKDEGDDRGDNEGKDHTPEEDDSEDEGDDDDNEDEQEESQREGTPNIQNQMLKSRVTLAASVMLQRLPPESTRRLTEPVQDTEATKSKITIRCQPIGSAPQLNPCVFKISYDQPFATLIKFITKKLRKKLPNKSDALYCYINNSFAPSPDEIIGQLHKHFASNNELVVSYCTVVAFG